MTNGDELERGAATLPPPPVPPTDPAPHDPLDDHEYFAQHFRALNERLDANDRILQELAASAAEAAKTQSRIVQLIDDALALSKASILITTDLAQHDFRISLIELKLGMKKGELPT